MLSLSDITTGNSKIQFGKPVFKGTRVPVESLFWHLEKGVSLNDFLRQWRLAKKMEIY